MFLKFLPDPSSWAELYNFLWANGHNYHDRWVIVIFYLHHSLEVCIIPNISTTQWVAGIGWVDTAYVTEVLPVLPDENYKIAYEQMAITTMCIWPSTVVKRVKFQWLTETLLVKFQSLAETSVKFQSEAVHIKKYPSWWKGCSRPRWITPLPECDIFRVN